MSQEKDTSISSPQDPSAKGGIEELPVEEKARQMYKWDRLRGGANGIVETCWQVFALLIAIRIFEADESLKQFLPAGMGIGMAISPLTLSFFNRLETHIGHLLAYLWIGVAAAITIMLIAPSMVIFAIGVLLAQIFATQGVPLLTSLYSSNYPSKVRGSRLSTTFVIGSALAIGFGYLGGSALDHNPDYYRFVLLGGIIAAFVYGYACRRIPSKPASSLRSGKVWANMSVAWKDKLFGAILIAWMLIGIGNLMMIPLRVEYLANPAYGINASNSQIALILVSIVLGFRILSTKIWGFFFDRTNMIVLRVILNSVFFVSVGMFFFSTNLIMISAGAALLGTAFGGGNIMWTLYVTKVAPPEKVTAYMSVHSFLTGFRMMAAPILGYTVLEFSNPATAATISLSLIALSTIIFLPMKSYIDKRAAITENA